MTTIPLLIREGCPCLADHVGEVIEIDAGEHVGRAMQSVDNLRQGFVSGTVLIDDGDAEITITPSDPGLHPMRFDMPGRQSAADKRSFAQALIAGACNGYVVIQSILPPDEDGEG